MMPTSLIPTASNANTLNYESSSKTNLQSAFLLQRLLQDEEPLQNAEWIKYGPMMKGLLMLMEIQVLHAKRQLRNYLSMSPAAKEIIQLLSSLCNTEWTTDESEEMLYQEVEQEVKEMLSRPPCLTCEVARILPLLKKRTHQGQEEDVADAPEQDMPEALAEAEVPTQATLPNSSLFLSQSSVPNSLLGQQTENAAVEEDPVDSSENDDTISNSNDDANDDNEESDTIISQRRHSRKQISKKRARANTALEVLANETLRDHNGENNNQGIDHSNLRSRLGRKKQRQATGISGYSECFDEQDIYHFKDILNNALLPQDVPLNEYDIKFAQTVTLLGIRPANSQLPNKLIGIGFALEKDAGPGEDNHALVLSQTTANCLAQSSPLQYMSNLFWHLERHESTAVFKLHLGDICLYLMLLAQVPVRKANEIILYNPQHPKESQLAKIKQAKSKLLEFMYKANVHPKGMAQRVDRRLKSGKRWFQLVKKYGLAILYLSPGSLGIPKGLGQTSDSDFQSQLEYLDHSKLFQELRGGNLWKNVNAYTILSMQENGGFDLVGTTTQLVGEQV